MKKTLLGLLLFFVLFSAVTFEQFMLMPPAARAQTNTFCAANLVCTVTVAWTFSGNLIATSGQNIFTAYNLNNIIFVDGIKYTKNDTGIQAALTACSSAGGGVVWLTDSSLGAYSTLTQTMTVAANCILHVGYMGSGLVSSANPVITLNGSGAALEGNNRYTASVISGSGAGAAQVNVAASCNGCRIENIRLNGSGSSGNGIEIQDNQRQLLIRNVVQGPIGECIHYNSGGNGFIFIELDQDRCDGFTGVGYDFQLSSANGTNLQIVDTYANGAGGAPTAGFGLSRLTAHINNSGDDSSVIGFKVGDNTGKGCMQWTAAFTELNTTAGIQINGAGCYKIDSHTSNLDQVPIQIQSAGANTIIEGPSTTSTVGANSITYSAASTGQHFLLGENNLDKVPLFNGISVHEETGTYEILGFPLGINLSNGSAPTFRMEINGGTESTNCFAIDRSAAFKHRICNEGTGGGVITGSAQDDLSVRTAAGAFNVSTDNGTSRAFVVRGSAGAASAKLHLSDLGSVCTNGELALSAGWQSTGAATVTAVAGNGQTCSWTITTGTTTAANPTVTDTLTNALPAATTVCWMNIYGGTHTAVAGESLRQTTLSATAPIFTANFTPTAAGTTYFVTRGCGP